MGGCNANDVTIISIMEHRMRRMRGQMRRLGENELDIEFRVDVTTLLLNESAEGRLPVTVEELLTDVEEILEDNKLVEDIGATVVVLEKPKAKQSENDEDDETPLEEAD